jgi:hypothetical protein
VLIGRRLRQRWLGQRTIAKQIQDRREVALNLCSCNSKSNRRRFNRNESRCSLCWIDWQPKRPTLLRNVASWKARSLV